MMPIPGLEALRYSWFEVKGQGFVLHGFLLFLVDERHFPEYVSGNGLGELDIWSGHECAVYVIHAPSAKWIQYTQETRHPWWRTFGARFIEDEDVSDLLEEHGDAEVLALEGGVRTMRQVFAPPVNEIRQAHEVAKVLRRFGLSPTETPCMVFFKDIDDDRVWSVDLKEFVGVDQPVLRAGLQAWFGGKDFARLLKEARRA